MRNILDVIKQMKEVIPTDQTGLMEDLDWIVNDVPWRPPEDTMFSWERLQEAIMRYIPKKDLPTAEEWKYKVVSILSTIPVETIKLDMIQHIGIDVAENNNSQKESSNDKSNS